MYIRFIRTLYLDGCMLDTGILIIEQKRGKAAFEKIIKQLLKVRVELKHL